MLNGQKKKKKKKKMPKIINFKFHSSFSNFGRDTPQMHEFWGAKLLLEEMLFETFTPIWSDVNKNKKNGKNPKLPNSLNNFGIETLPRSMHDFFGMNLMCTFRGDVV